MKISNQITTWAQLAKHLNVTTMTLHRHRKKGGPETKDVDQWRHYLVQQRAVEPRGGAAVLVDGKAYTAGDIQDLRGRLLAAQERHHSASAGLRELQLQKEQQNLLPEQILIEKYQQTMVPLRRLIDALPRSVAHRANPGNPSVAEKAIRQDLNERVFSEMARIESHIESERQRIEGGENHE